MPGTGRAEVYFIVAMMVLIMIVSATAVIFFFKTYKKEMKERDARIKAKLAAADKENEDDAS